MTSDSTGIDTPATISHLTPTMTPQQLHQQIQEQLAIARGQFHEQQFAKAEHCCCRVIEQLERYSAELPPQTQAVSSQPDDDCQSADASDPLPSASITPALIETELIELRLLLGMALHQQNRLDEARQCYQQILDSQPDHAPACNNLAVVLRRLGRNSEAQAVFERAIALNPNSPEAYNNLGNLLWRQGRLEPAQAAYEQAVAIAPDSSDIRLNWANALRDGGRWPEAIAQYQEIVRRDPTFADVYNNLGNLLQRLQKYEQAIACYRAGLQHGATPKLYNNLGAAYQSAGRNLEAIATYQRALTLKPSYPDAYYNLGNALRATDRLEEATVAYRKAIALNPNAPEIYNNLGLVLHDLRQLPDALDCFERAIALQPDYPDAVLNRGLSYLILGDLERGFADYELRWRVIGRDFKPPRQFDPPRWNGEALPHGTVLLHAEQGLGDTLQFVRFASGVAERVSRVVLECQPPLVKLLQSVPGINQVIAKGDALPEFDAHAPLMSLPHLLGTTLVTIPTAIPYINPPDPLTDLASTAHAQAADESAADPTADFEPCSSGSMSQLQSLIAQGSDRLKVGIVWAGSPTHLNDRHRSCPFQWFERLGAIPGVQLYSLQKGKRESDLESSAPEEPDIREHQALNQRSPQLDEGGDRPTQGSSPTHSERQSYGAAKLDQPPPPQRSEPEPAFDHQQDSDGQGSRPSPDTPSIINLAPHLHDFTDTAWAIAQLDLVITVDTSVAHLAGALGKPVWIVLGVASDWRWLLHRDDSPWYPTARVFRQSQAGNWHELLDRVERGLWGAIAQSAPLIPIWHPTQNTAQRTMSETSDITDQLHQLWQLSQNGQWDEVVHTCQAMLAENPDQPHALTLLGRIAYQQRRYDEAIAHYERLCQLNPCEPEVTPDIWSQIGNAYLHSDRPTDALRWYRACLQHDPQRHTVRNNLGVALRNSGHPTEAIAHYRYCLAHQPDAVDTYYNLANALSDQQHLNAAVHAYQQTVRLNPSHANGWNNLANALKDLNRIEEAIACYRRALELVPTHASAHHNLGYLLLLTGNLKQGFAEYEWRWRVKHFKAPRVCEEPLWNGSELQGKTILIHTEQGFGDTLQFIRYAALVKQKQGRIVLECRPPLVRLLKAMPAVDQVIARGESVPAVDVHAPLLSLPHLLGTTAETIPADIPYLRSPSKAPNEGSDEMQLHEFALSGSNGSDFDGDNPNSSSLASTLLDIPKREASHPTTGPLKIGIAWAGSPTHQNDRHRSCPFSYFWALLQTPGTQFFSLQKGDRQQDIVAYGADAASASAEGDTPWQLIDLGDRLTDFAVTAATIEQMDLIITVDTAVAHLAGALGKPVWILLSHTPDWRWQLTRDDSPWYPTARLFRQPHPGDWASVFAQVQSALKPYINKRQQPPPASTKSPAETDPPKPVVKPSTSATLGDRLPLGIGIELSTSTGWGVFGTNLTLHVLKTSHWIPIPLLPPLAGSQFNPLHQEFLRPLFAEQQRVDQILADHPDQKLALPSVVLKALGNHFITAPQLQRITGERTVGLIFFEDAHLTAEDVERASRYDLIVAGSSWNADVMKSQGIQHVKTVCQGIDPTLFHPAPRSGFWGDRFVIFSGGKLEYRKGQDLVIHAFKRFHQRHPDALLITAWHNIWPATLQSLERSPHISGSPKLDAQRRLQLKPWLIANGIPAQACLDLGMIPNPLMGQMIREADIALFPNRCEGGTNLAAMECIACGIPTVLSANTGHLDLLNAGLGIPLNHQVPVSPHDQHSPFNGWGESDIDEIVAALEHVYGHRGSANCDALKQARIMMSEWSWEVQTQRLLETL